MASLYRKNTVLVEPHLPLAYDSAGSQIDTYGSAVSLVCNVQVNGLEPTQLLNSKQKTARLFSHYPNGVKMRDRVTWNNQRFVVKEVIPYYNYIDFGFHHIEAEMETLESTVV